MLDTGALRTLVRASVAKSIGLQCDSPPTSYRSSTGPLQITLCEPVTLAIDQDVPGFVLGAGDLDGLSPQFDGILGVDFMARFVMVLGDGNVQFVDRQLFHRADPALTMQPGPAGPVVQASFDTISKKDVSVSFFLDTGSSYDVMLPQDSTLFAGLPRRTVPAGTAGKRYIGSLYMLPKFRVGDHVHYNVNMLSLPADYPLGGIGLGIIGDYTATFDFPGHRLWLDDKPNHGP